MRIRTDQGSQFVNDIVAELLKLIGVEHELTLAYSKEESAIVERANKEVMRHLKAILLDKNIVNDWAISLPLVQRIMNASVHSAIGVSPAQLLFGNAVCPLPLSYIAKSSCSISSFCCFVRSDFTHDNVCLTQCYP